MVCHHLSRTHKIHFLFNYPDSLGSLLFKYLFIVPLPLIIQRASVNRSFYESPKKSRARVKVHSDRLSFSHISSYYVLSLNRMHFLPL